MSSSLSPQLTVLGEVALAMALGALLGVERQLAHKPAGLRTHMMIAGAASLLVGLVGVLLRRYLVPPISPLVRADPVPIITAVVTAVGFLGAGSIIRHSESDHIEGLTTAASLLLAAAIGATVGLEQFPLAVGVTLLALATLRGLRAVEGWLDRRKPGPPEA
ncbi:MAG TPA: MgtC/SapB family protein [Thermoanaerobaculia bacterium]|nr:MgtC/SapB family protein [Thermoanaerobaculia bacterium]